MLRRFLLKGWKGKIACCDAEVRVSNRVEKGGHSVDPERIIRRYGEALTNLFPALLLADKAYLFDNSTFKMELVAEAANGQIEILTDKAPNWFVEYVVKKLSLG